MHSNGSEYKFKFIAGSESYAFKKDLSQHPFQELDLVLYFNLNLKYFHFKFRDSSIYYERAVLDDIACNSPFIFKKGSLDYSVEDKDFSRLKSLKPLLFSV